MMPAVGLNLIFYAFRTTISMLRYTPEYMGENIHQVSIRTVCVVWLFYFMFKSGCCFRMIIKG